MQHQESSTDRNSATAATDQYHQMRATEKNHREEALMRTSMSVKFMKRDVGEIRKYRSFKLKLIGLMNPPYNADQQPVLYQLYVITASAFT